MFIWKIKKLLYKKITQKINVILLRDFNITLDNKDRSTGNKDFCKSREKRRSLIMEMTFGDAKTRTAAYIRIFMARIILTPVLIGLTQVLTCQWVLI